MDPRTAGTLSVVILVPVLARPWRVSPLMASVDKGTPEPHRLLFIAGEDDTEELAELVEAGADFITVAPEQRSYACKINAGYRATTEPLLFSGADDLDFHPGWLPNATRLIEGPIQVVGTTDLCNDRTTRGVHSTHSLFTRSYIDEHGTIDAPGKVLHEGYRHDYVDDEFVQTAMARGVYAHAFDAVVEHLHPNAGKAEDDPTYQEGRKWSHHGRRLFRQRRHKWMRLSNG